MNKKLTVELKDHVCLDSEHGSFVLQDVRAVASSCELLYSSIIEIDSFKVSYPNKGFGSLFIKNYLSEIPDDAIVILKAEPIYDSENEWDDALKSGDFDNSLKLIESFYSKNGFLNINELVGYEYGQAMIYGNAVGKMVSNEIICHRNRKKGGSNEPNTTKFTEI